MTKTSSQILEAATSANWAFFDETFEHDGLTIDLDWAIEAAARTVASAVQLDDRYASLSPEAGYDALAGTDATATDERVRDRAIQMLAYDRAHKGH